MRLLRMNHDGTFSLTQFTQDNVPNYAILSHTWRGEQECSYQDVIAAANKRNMKSSKFNKLYFCGEQVKKDGLQYFWIDTCCIDKTNSAELSEAINSMFDWYRLSNKCYVLLTDVSVRAWNRSPNHMLSQLRKSSWFTRGWTLQELLASPTVEFFSRERRLLGSKNSLEKDISEITGIPIAAFSDYSLSRFSTEEKLSWMKNRQTTLEEDSIYALLGILDIHMPVRYGEGRQLALKRLLIQDKRWSAPFPRNVRFTGREVELAEIESKLFSVEHFTKYAIHGSAGVGKTELVRELLCRVRKRYENLTVIWIQAITMHSLDDDCQSTAKRFGIQGTGGEDDDVKQLVQDYLSEDAAGPWILVYDSADDIQMWTDQMASQQSKRLIDYIPRSQHGRVIFTTRDRKVGVKLAQQNLMELPTMAEDSAVRMLRKCVIDKTLVDSAPADARTTLSGLTNLPLAINSVAAYINGSGITLANFLEKFEALSTKGPEHDSRYPEHKNSLATVLLNAIQQVQERDYHAAKIMSFMACVDHKDIPQLLLPPGSTRKQEMNAIRTLSDCGIIIQPAKDQPINMHILVHFTIREWLRNNGVFTDWARRAVARLEEVFPDHEHNHRAIWRAYLPHALHALESNDVAPDDSSRKDLEWKVASCYYSDGRFTEADALFRRVLEYRTNVLGAKHPDTLKSMAKLALTCHAQSRFAEARELGIKAMEAQKRVLGEEDPETMSTMSHLAMTFSDMSQWKEAEELELHTMELRKRVLGPDHPDTLVGMSNLVYLYNCQGWWKQAEELGRETITSRKKVLGVEHPDTLLSIGNLAHTYNNEGRYKEAEELLVQVMNIRIKVLGKDHPHTLSGMSNLGVSYHNQGRWDEAEAIQSQVVAARKVLLGPEHFSTLTSMAHLSLAYQSQGRRSEAEELGLQVMELRKKVLGPEHHHTLTSMANLASIYIEEQPNKAEELLVQVLAIRIRVLGMEHNHTLTGMEQLAALYRKQGRTKEAKDLEAQVSEVRDKGGL